MSCDALMCIPRGHDRYFQYYMSFLDISFTLSLSTRSHRLPFYFRDLMASLSQDAGCGTGASAVRYGPHAFDFLDDEPLGSSSTATASSSATVDDVDELSRIQAEESAAIYSSTFEKTLALLAHKAAALSLSGSAPKASTSSAATAQTRRTNPSKSRNADADLTAA